MRDSIWELINRLRHIRGGLDPRDPLGVPAELLRVEQEIREVLTFSLYAVTSQYVNLLSPGRLVLAVCTSRFNAVTYLAAHLKPMDWFDDTIRRGLFDGLAAVGSPDGVHIYRIELVANGLDPEPGTASTNT
jgi:hypothetical protein